MARVGRRDCYNLLRYVTVNSYRLLSLAGWTSSATARCAMHRTKPAAWVSENGLFLLAAWGTSGSGGLIADLYGLGAALCAELIKQWARMALHGCFLTNSRPAISRLLNPVAM